MPRSQACCVPRRFKPRSVGRLVEQVAAAAGVDIGRIERFAHPVSLERSRAAELATAAHPVLADGPSVMTLLETVTSALVARGLDPEDTSWDAWRNEDGRWTVQMGWKAGLSDNVAHFRFTPGAHGGTVTAFDDAACELIDPDFARPLGRWPPLLNSTSRSRSLPPPHPSHRKSRSRRGPARVSRPSPRGRTCFSACAPAASADLALT